MGARAVALLAAIILAPACSSDNAGKEIVMPQLHGTTNRAAQEELARLGLRWRYYPAKRTWSRAPPPNVWSTADDDYVVFQSPAAGTRVARSAVVTLRTSCSLEPLPPGMVCID